MDMRRRGLSSSTLIEKIKLDREHDFLNVVIEPGENVEGSSNQSLQPWVELMSTCIPQVTVHDEDDNEDDEDTRIKIPSTEDDSYPPLTRDDSYNTLLLYPGLRSRRGSDQSSTCSTSSFSSFFRRRSKSSDFTYEEDSSKCVRSERSMSLMPGSHSCGLYPNNKILPTSTNSNNLDFRHMSAHIQLLQCIRQNDCKSVKKLLKKNNIDVNLVIDESGSLLNEAAYRGCRKCMGMLLKCGCYTNMGDDAGWTPLHAAVLGCNHDAVKFLLEHHALPNQLNDEGLSPCHLSVLSDDIRILHELMMQGGDPLLEGVQPSPFQMAIDLEKNHAIKYFLYMPSLLTTTI